MARYIDWGIRAEAYRLLIRGNSTLAAAELLGIPRTTLVGWVKLAGMRIRAGRHGGLVLPPGLEPQSTKPRGYHRLTLSDRVFIEQALSGPGAWSIRRVAAHLGVAASTISREISRHRIAHGHGRHVSGKEQHYHAEVAHYTSAMTRHRERSKKLDDPVLRGRVVALLNQGWSPLSIAGRLRLEFPNQPEYQVSHETIYQALYVQGKGALRHELTVVKALRTGRTGRIPQSKLPRRSNRPWLDGARLSDRPAIASDRAVPGHWEGDLVVGPNNSAVITLVERRSRFALIGKLPGRRDSATVVECMREMVQTLPKALFTTVTWDQGAEMAQHVDFTIATGCDVFFCDPHSPWQRGSNEQFNGLLREFFPKGTDFNQVTDEELSRAQHLLNTRTRKTLEFWTPSE